MNDRDKQKKAINFLAPIPIACVLTVAVGAGAIVVFFERQVWQLSGNEIGDYLAGFAGALALTWIIATIFLQKEELELQRAEVSRLADEARIQSDALRANAKTFFMDRWERCIVSFAVDHEQAIIDLRQALLKLHVDSGELEREALSRARQSGKSMQITGVDDLSGLYVSRFHPAPNDTLEYHVLGDAKVMTKNGHNQIPVQVKLDVTYSLPTQEIIELFQQKGAYTEYLVNLTQEGIALGQEAMMKSYDLRHLVNSRTSEGIDRHHADLLDYLLAYFIVREKP